MKQSILSALIFAAFIFSGTAMAGDITDTYANGDTLTSGMMDNIKSEVNDNHSRIQSLETLASRTRVLSFPARTMSYDPASTIISTHARGLTWASNYASTGTLVLKKPGDYTTGDITFYVFFQTTSGTAGTVNFFLRPTSYNSGEGMLDPGSVSSTGAVAVSGVSGFGTVYELTVTIPAGRMTNDWWWIGMQRNSSSETYTEDVIVTSVSLTYSTN